MTILFIDCYDSFSYNLVRLVEKVTGVNVEVVHHDSLSSKELLDYIMAVDAIIVGPGPGHPGNPADRGIIDELWTLAKSISKPVLGICFGFQSMALAFGGEVLRLPEPKHGQYGYIQHNDTALFNGLKQNYKVVRYHSLYANINMSSELEELARSEDGILMGLKHKELPLYGVQFHPESILSEYGEALIANFYELSKAFGGFSSTPKHLEFKKALHNEPLIPATSKPRAHTPHIVELAGEANALGVGDFLRDINVEFTLLHSAAFPGKWSIFGILDNATHLRCKDEVTLIGPLHQEPNQKLSGDFWSHLSAFMEPKLLKSDPPYNLPFYGGVMGYVTYEKCSETSIPKHTEQANSDASFVYVDRCIVIGSGKTYLVGPKGWSTGLLELGFKVESTEPEAVSIPAACVTVPDEKGYIDGIDKCFEFLRSGDSYELCYCRQTQCEFTDNVRPWDLFKHLVKINPAPYSTYFDFDDSLVGTSPERFMSWGRAAGGDKVQFRPIKGTVAKVNHDLASATEILKSDKERAENLMIVDLIRHDLGLLLPEVDCPQIMRVEEYATVYQLVSVIEGKLGGTPFKGLDVLKHSLPPGSMTGAPKIRSVEILQTLESEPRGLYSGTAGYWSIDDSGDFSVVIRSAFRYKTSPQIWRLGAGGAITILSDANDELEEMKVKLTSALRAFQ